MKLGSPTDFTRFDLSLFWASSFVVKSNHWSSENAGRYSRILCMHRAYFEIKPIGNVDIEIFETLAENSALILRLVEARGIFRPEERKKPGKIVFF